MNMEFGPARWERIRQTYSQWWAGELERPIIPVILWGRSPGREMPTAPILTQGTCADLSLSPEDIVDRLDYELSTRTYLADAFPCVGMDVFGPGVAGAFLGAALDNSSGSVWFHPCGIRELADIHFEYDANNPWLGRIKDICAAGMKKWKGDVLVGMTDLGGTLDILSTFRPSALLPMDLYDDPKNVKRLTREIHDLWFRFYGEINDVLQPVNPGYSDWSGIYSDKPSYMLQCDFAYMIGPSMFDEFVRPELTESCRKLSRSFYHLDGPGQIPHLDSLLDIPELDGIQWIPGDGNGWEWSDLYRRIHASGKRMQIIGGRQHLDDVVDLLGTGKGICAMSSFGIMDSSANGSEELLRWLEKYGIQEGV